MTLRAHLAVFRADSHYRPHSEGATLHNHCGHRTHAFVHPGLHHIRLQCVALSSSGIGDTEGCSMIPLVTDA